MEAEGDIQDVREVPRTDWARSGGKGAFLYLKGVRESGFIGMVVGEIHPGGSLNPERHLYEELIYILKGQRATQIRQESQAQRSFEWGEGSFFAPPLNSWHRL